MGFIQEFKDFAMRGSVLDLAIGVIIGGAFGAIVNSAVSDVLMPPIGMILGKVDFKDLYLSLDGQSYESLAKAKAAGAAIIAYGLFLNTVINFLIIAFILFMIIKQINRLKKPAAAEGPSTKECPFCANSVPIKAVRCGFCTSELTPGIIPVTVS